VVVVVAVVVVATVVVVVAVDVFMVSCLADDVPRLFVIV
jgi:hypothetical protein